MLFRQQDNGMMNFIESNAGRIAARIQTIGVAFDPEILSLPGGSFLAAFIWLHASVLATLERWAAHRHSSVGPIAAPACAGCVGRH
jgi:hypothetical protein